MQLASCSHDPVDRLDIIVDPDAEPGDVLGALARLLISMAQDRVSNEQASELAEEDT